MTVLDVSSPEHSICAKACWQQFAELLPTSRLIITYPNSIPFDR